MSRSNEPTTKPKRSRPARVRQRGSILDLFAGAGGWEEGLRPLGLSALGVECDSSACETAQAAGHARLQADLATLDPQDFAPVWGLIGSPPCQAYSTAGKGLGALDKPLVIACAHELAAGNDSRTAWQEGCRDARSLLTVEPLRFALALRPRWVALEQVPPVLELWSLFAQLLATHGYHTAAGILRAECYGVPQTRRRAFLIASLDGPVSLPEPTHRSYDARRRETPAEEIDLLPWVSMAEALGFQQGGRVDTNNQTCGGTRPRGSSRPLLAPAHTLDTASGSWRFTRTRGSCRDRAASAQPSHFDSRQRRTRPRPISKPAPTLLASGLANGAAVWTRERPATTVACDPRIMPPGAKRCATRPDAPGRSEGAVRVTVAQAALLQGFPADYPWQGSRARQFQQIGNAVPPPLARRVLEAAITPGGAS